MKSSHWKTNSLGESEIYISLFEDVHSCDLEIDSIRFAAPYKTLGGSVKYQAVEFEDFPLFCGDVVSIYGGKYIFLCSRRIEHENERGVMGHTAVDGMIVRGGAEGIIEWLDRSCWFVGVGTWGRNDSQQLV
jgi:hypothetical protein